MPVNLLNNSSGGTVSSGDDQDYFLSEFNNGLTSDTFGFSFGTSDRNGLVVGGAIVASGNGIEGGTGNNNSVTVLSSGSVSGNGGIRFNEGAAYRVFNNGDITGFLFDGIGLIDTAGTSEIVNNGSISSALTAILLLGERDPTAVFDVTNTGEISGLRGISTLEGETNITNTGSIVASREGVTLGGSSFAGDVVSTLFNSGTIQGGLNAVLGGNDIQHVFNEGQLFGNVSLGRNDDRIDTRSGTVTGDIDLGDGNDVAIGSQEDDTIIAGAGDDIVRAGGDNDTVTGGDGDDILRGAGGDDNLRGEGDDDLIFGGTGNDVMRGNAGNDELRGGTGDDNVAGGSGDDVINGGRGDDTLTGNSGADVFVFNASAGNDLITDFRVNLDMIDLSALGTRFNRVDAATEVVNGNAIIDLDMLGGDGTIVVRGVGGSLDANDFLF